MWAYDAYAAIWGTPFIADGKVYAGDEDGDVVVFKLGRELEILAENFIDHSVNTTIMAVDQTLIVPAQGKIYAIEKN